MTKTEIKNPPLRFPEFTDDWFKYTISSIAECGAGGTPSTSIDEYWGGDIKWMSSGEVHKKLITDVRGRITQLGLDNSSAKILPKNCVLIALAGQGKTRGTVCVNSVELCTNQSIAYILVNKNHYYKFIYYNLDRRYKELRKLSSGGGRGGLNLNLINGVKIILPSPKEQEKIANFLSAVDKRIELLQQKFDNMTQYKMGLMQQIFTQKIRFKDDNGQNYPDWEEKKLGDICEKENSPFTMNDINQNGKYDIYGAGGICGKVDRYISDKEYIGIVKDGSGVGNMFLCEPKTSIVGTLNKIKEKNNNDIKFIYYYMNNINFVKYIIGGAIPHIYFRDYSKDKGMFPCEQEQQKIAEFLSIIDKKIEKTQQQINETKSYKKSLMQQMFV